MRLDSLLVERAFVESRTRGRWLIEKGAVSVDGKSILKPSANIAQDANIEITDTLCFVSRAGLKLHGFLEETKISLKNRTILDIGSSTGGFVEVALKSGAKCVVCVDVGSNQLHKSLREDSRVIFFEETDIRKFYVENLNKELRELILKERDFAQYTHAPQLSAPSSLRFSLATCDVSFISLSKILPDIARLCDEAILLFKPQFEVGKEAKRSAKGVVKDSAKVAKRLAQFRGEVEGIGFKILNVSYSKVKGKEGNEECFWHIKR